MTEKKLLEERAELENKVLDLRVHISFDKNHGRKFWASYEQECEKHGIKTLSPAMFEAFGVIKKVAPTSTPRYYCLVSLAREKNYLLGRLHRMSNREERFCSSQYGGNPRWPC